MLIVRDANGVNQPIDTEVINGMHVAKQRPTGSTITGYTIVPTPGGTRLPNLPCHAVVLKNPLSSGLTLYWATSQDGHRFELQSGYDTRIPASNAQNIWVFDPDDNEYEMGFYTET